MEKNSKQKEELVRRLAEDEEKEEPTKNRIYAFAIDLNGNGMEYKYKKTSVKG